MYVDMPVLSVKGLLLKQSSPCFSEAKFGGGGCGGCGGCSSCLFVVYSFYSSGVAYLLQVYSFKHQHKPYSTKLDW
jgi:hypothetical protein